jgi:hypothetical protein
MYKMNYSVEEPDDYYVSPRKSKVKSLIVDRELTSIINIGFIVSLVFSILVFVIFGSFFGVLIMLLFFISIIIAGKCKMF